MYRIGIGQDSHKIIQLKEKSSKPLTLGGVIINEYIEVVANSDGDMILHSLCNALNTAIGKGSFDGYAGPLCKKGITDSKEYLLVALNQIRLLDYKINNISLSLEAGKPPLESKSPMIRESLSKLLSLDISNIGISITSGNGLTSYSEGKGILCTSIVSLIKIGNG